MRESNTRGSAMLAATLLMATASYALDVKLEPYPAKSFPGVSAVFHITLRNDASVPVVVDNGAGLTVLRGSEEFSAQFFEGEATGPFSSGGGEWWTVLQPGQSREAFYGPGEPFIDNLWFSDPRLNAPGTSKLVLSVAFYELTIEDQRTLAQETTEDGMRAVVEEFLQTSNRKWAKSVPTPFEVMEPQGVDRQVWETMKSVDGSWTVNSWGKGSVASDVVKQYPSSAYAPYALIHAPATELANPVRATEEILRIHADSPVMPEIARMAFERRRLEALGGEDLQARLRSRDQAEAALVGAQKNARVPEWWKAKLRDAADSLPTKEAVIQLHADAHGKHKMK